MVLWPSLIVSGRPGKAKVAAMQPGWMPKKFVSLKSEI